MTGDLLRVSQVSHIFGKGSDAKKAVDGVDITFAIGRPSVITIAGESGSGKSTLAMMALGFLPPSSGKILYRGSDIYLSSKSSFHVFRRRVQAVFQNPFDVFNPFYKVDHALHLVIRKFGLSTAKTDAKKMIYKALEDVHLDPSRILGKYPHQLSGGQLQRTAIARALLAKPELLIADEPVSMIDASLRLQVLQHLIELKENHGVSILYITHDLSTALQISDELLIMYKGKIVERGSAENVILAPEHPYTQLLMRSIPVPDPKERWDDETPDELPGDQQGSYEAETL